ncbi:zinc ribbon domain-containing protein [Clostridium botulinum]|nr:zinc ribbon domain-containing protein [Clostridium botulinum]NFF37414.1 zinc ribbon domain-containing protein [Clostridium botulinum]NFI49526.1 zinc ribbon domain-containing protein [Clostridium botulinum]NFI60079.1 zinc ribbon domain-containing protein [Clostridium botulinum]NFI69503.1 zinc ribbon domain-containing protein [Clostridium botulinum]
MEEISKDEVYKILDAYDTKELARVFVEYMISIGVKKLDRRKKDKRNIYSVHGDCNNWNRVECYYHKDSTEYCSEDLDITLRKRAGYYLIIGRKGERAFERSYDSIVHYNEKLFNEIVQDHKKFFQMILSGM